MSFTFDPDHMRDDLAALARGASSFFAPQSPERLKRLASDLGFAVAGAKASGNNNFAWRTPQDAPLQLRESREWKGGSQDFDPLSAEISINYQCCYLPAQARVKLIGAAVLDIRDVGGDGSKVVHFDVEQGGWTEITNGVQHSRAGHPPFHAQFYGHVNDIPRLPSLIVHPVDVINLALVELHQKSWRDYLGTSKARSEFRHFPLRQRTRLNAILNSWARTVGDSSSHALVMMQRVMTDPLSL